MAGLERNGGAHEGEGWHWAEAWVWGFCETRLRSPQRGGAHVMAS